MKNGMVKLDGDKNDEKPLQLSALLAAIEHADTCINGCVHWMELHGDGSGSAFSEVYPREIFGFSTVEEATRKFNEVDADFYEKLRAGS